MRVLHRILAVFSIFFVIAFLPRFSWSMAENNVRVTRFHWMHAQTEHFDIYFDKGTERLVPKMGQYLEEAWRDVGRRLDFQVPERTPFFFYSNHNEFEQTNIVPIGEGTGGVTEAAKNRLLIFNDGSDEWLKHVIPHEFGHVVQFNVLYGGFWKSARLLKSPFYPLWVMEGMAEYSAGEIDAPTGDMVVRDAVANNNLPLLPELQGFNHVKPNQVTLAYKTGEAAMNFLADEYGPHRVHDLLYTMKDYFDISSALEEMLGIDLNRFDQRFHEYMKDKYAPLIARTKPPTAYGPQVTASDGIPQANTGPIISPDGKTLYFMSDRQGPPMVYEQDLETGKSQPLIKTRWSKFEYLDTKGRALSVSPDGHYLAFSGEKKQKDFLYIYDFRKKKLNRYRVPFDAFRSPVFAPDGEKLVCVGMERGYNDLYLINLKGKVLDRLTNSPQDEKDPIFSLDGTHVIFSGEMMGPDNHPAGWDIFELDLQTKAMKRITALDGSETEPEVLPDGSLLFVRDRNDAGDYGFNLWRLEKSSTPVQLTDFTGGGFSPRYSKALNRIYYVGFYKAERQIYRADWDFVPALAQAPATPVAVASADDWGDPPYTPGSRNHSRAAQTWTNQSGSPLLLNARPYRFNASTDLFIPFFFYSTDQGLALVDVWQFSELMGNHQFQQQMQYASGADLLDFSLFYTYARFRPQFTLGFQTQRYYLDFTKDHQRKEITAVGLVTYPLDRVNAVDVGVGSTNRQDRFFDESEDDTTEDERFVLAGFTHDTVTGRYLEPTFGHRTSLFYQQSFDHLGGNQEYKSGGLQTARYFRLPRESTFVSRLFYGRSVGATAQVFRLGGSDRIRALSQESEEHKKSNIVLTSAEVRYRIKYLNARTKFLFPDFFFKAAYLVAFDDFGYGWNSAQERDDFRVRSAENSAGVGIMWPTFVLQSFRLDLSVQWAHRTTTGANVWYISVGPSF